MGELQGVAATRASLESSARQVLQAEWPAVLDGTAVAVTSIPDPIADAIRRRILSSKGKTYRYVLPTQLLAKVVRRGRPSPFLQLVGAELDERKADVTHRQRWRDLLNAI